MAFQERFSMSDLAAPWWLSDSAFFLPEFSSVFSAYLSSALSTRPRQFVYSFTNESNTQIEGPPTPYNRLDWGPVISGSVRDSIMVINGEHETFIFCKELPWNLCVHMNRDLEPTVRPQCVGGLCMGLGALILAVLWPPLPCSNLRVAVFLVVL